MMGGPINSEDRCARGDFKQIVTAFAREEASIVGYRFRTRQYLTLVHLEKETKGAGANFDNFAWKYFESGDTAKIAPQLSNTKEVFDFRRREFPRASGSKGGRRI